MATQVLHPWRDNLPGRRGPYRCGLSSPALTMRPATQIASRFHMLDALRGIAALAVVFWHWQHFFYVGTLAPAGFDPRVQPFFGVFKLFYLQGAVAVDLFFSLSGFIFFWLYARRIAEGTVNATDFLVLRLSRLYPLHVVTLIMVAAGQAVHHGVAGGSFVYPDNDLWHFLLHVALLPSVGLEAGFSFNAPVWSVSVEVLLYVMFFLVCRARLHRPWVLLLLSCAGILVLTRLYAPIGRGVGSFFLGGLTFHLFTWIRERMHVRWWTGISVGLTAVLWLLTVGFVGADMSLSNLPGLWRLQGLFAVIILFPLTILALALLDQGRTASVRLLSMLGNISYSSYLLHFPLQLAFALVVDLLGIDRAFFGTGMSFLLYFGLLIPLSLASYHWLELPAQMALRRWWSGRRANMHVANAPRIPH